MVKMMWKMKVTVTGALGMVSKSVRKRIEEVEISGRIVTIQNIK